MATEEKGSRKSRKRVVSANSSDDEAAETPMQPCPALEAAPSAKGAPPSKAAPRQKKKKVADVDEEEKEEEMPSSEADESDDDFAPDNEDDFKNKMGKKGKGKGGKDTKTRSGNTDKKSTAAVAKAKAPSQRSHQVKSINPPLLCSCTPFNCANYSSMVLPQAIEQSQSRPAVGKAKLSKMEKAVAALAYDNPGVKAAVPKELRAASVLPPPVKKVAATIPPLSSSGLSTSDSRHEQVCCAMCFSKSFNAFCTSLVLFNLFLVCRTSQIKGHNQQVLPRPKPNSIRLLRLPPQLRPLHVPKAMYRQRWHGKRLLLLLSVRLLKA